MHPLGIFLRDPCILFCPQLLSMLVAPSVINGEGVVREYMCSCADMWADIAMCNSTPLGSTLQ